MHLVVVGLFPAHQHKSVLSQVAGRADAAIATTTNVPTIDVCVCVSVYGVRCFAKRYQSAWCEARARNGGPRSPGYPIILLPILFVLFAVQRRKTRAFLGANNRQAEKQTDKKRKDLLLLLLLLQSSSLLLP